MQYNYSSLPVDMQLANPSSNFKTRWSKFTKSSLFLKMMISDLFLSSGAFLNHNRINKPAKNNKRTLIAAVFHFVDPLQKRQVKTSQDDTTLCQLQLSVKKLNESQMLHKFSTWVLFAC